MATFKACIYADNRRADGTYNVKIRLTHHRQTLKVSTPLYVGKGQITKALKIKDQRIIDATDSIIRRWRGYIAVLGVKADAMTGKQLLDYFRDKDKYGDAFTLDYIDYARGLLPRWSGSTHDTYSASVNAFERIIGHIDINAITPHTLTTFEREYTKKVKASTFIRTLSQLATLYKLAQRQYNNPYSGDVKIPHSPFEYYTPSVSAETPEKRALPVAVVQSIINTPYTEKYSYNLVKDLWLLSFGMCGVNLADMLTWRKDQYENGVITYRRKKIATRLGEKATMQIRVEPCLQPIFEKYIAKRGDLLFDFKLKHCLCATHYHLKKIAKAIEWGGILHLYSARHSWATIARNDCEISLEVVNEALIHIDGRMRMTDMYIKRDYHRVWEANKKVLSLFDWSAVCG